MTDEQKYCWSGERSNSDSYMSSWDVNGDQDFFANRELCDELEISYGTAGNHQFVSGLWS